MAASLSILESYVSNALECVEFKLSKSRKRNAACLIHFNPPIPFWHPVRNREDVECSGDDDKDTFHPAYAHQVFDESENIFGYRDLKVRLYYTAGALNMYLGLKYSQRVDDLHQPEFKADNVNGKISDLLSSGCYYTNMDEFLKTLSVDDDFLPFGEKVDSVQVEQVVNGRQRNFEFYRCDMQTKGFASFHVRLQTFLMWFVDAASYIDADDPSWTFFVWLVHLLLAIIMNNNHIYLLQLRTIHQQCGSNAIRNRRFYHHLPVLLVSGKCSATHQPNAGVAAIPTARHRHQIHRSRLPAVPQRSQGGRHHRRRSVRRISAHPQSGRRSIVSAIGRIRQGTTRRRIQQGNDCRSQEQI